MATKPTYEELEQRVKELQEEPLERQCTEGALQQKNAELDSFIQNIPDMAWVKDPDSRFIAVNKAFGEAVGMDPESLINQTCEVCFGKKAAKKFREDDRKVMKSREQTIIEETVADSQKNEVWLETIKSPILNESGKVLGTVGIARDITRRKRAEEALRESEERFRNLVNNTNDLITMADESANWTFLSPSVKKILGYEPPEMVGRSAFEFMFPDDIPSTQDAHQTVVKNGTEFWEYENRWIRKDGRIVSLAWTVVPVQDEQGKIIGTEGVARDITERKRAEQALGKVLEDQSILLDNIDTQIWYLTDNENHSAVNKALANFLGVQKSDLEGKNMYDILPKEEADICVGGNKEVFETKRQLRTEEWVKNGKGELCLLSITKTPKLDKDGNVEYVVCSAEDITELKLAEEKLLESEKKYRTLVDSSLTGICIHQDGTYAFVNDRLAEMHGYEPEELLGTDPLALIHPDQREAFKEIASREPKEEVVSQKYEVCGLRKDGTPIWCEMTVAPIEYKGKPALMGNTIDITERKQIEDALKESEEKYRGLFENSTDFVYTLDLKGNFTDVNKAAQHLTGYTKTELIGMNNRDYTPREAHKGILQAFNRVFETGEPLQDFPLEVTVKDGSKRYFETSVTLLRKGDEIIGFQGSSRDITDRKQVVVELRESEEKYRDLVENINDVIFAVDLKGAVTYISPVVEGVLGYRPQEVVRRNFSEFIHEEDLPFVMERFKDLLAGKIGPSEYRILTKGGEVRWVRSSSLLILEGNSPVGIHGVLTDITERKQAEEERELLARYPNENPNPVLRLAKDGTILYANEASRSVLQMCGCQTGEHSPHKWCKLTLGVLSSGSSKEIEVKCEGRVFSLTFAPVVDAGYVNLYGLDITERKRAEEALRESEGKHKTLIDSSLTGIFIHQDRRYVFLNNKFADIHGYKPQELLGKDPMTLIHPDDKEALKKMASKRLRKETVPEQYEVRRVKKDGEPIWCQMMATVIDYEGRLAIMGNLVDISDRKQAEDERESLARFPSENPSPIMRIAEDGTILYGNAASQALLNTWACEVGEPLPDKWREVTLDVLTYGSNKDAEVECVNRVFSLTFASIEGAEYVNIYGLDITERKQAEEKLKHYSEMLKDMVDQRTKELEDAQEQLIRREKLATLGHIAGGVAHELRNPLGAIRNSYYFLNMVLEDPRQEVKEALALIDKEVVTSERIIKSLLDFGRPEAFAPRKVDIKEVIQTALARVSVPVNIQVVTQSSETLPEIPGDSEQLTQIIGNLITNAVQAMSDGGRLVVKSEAPDSGRVTISLSDTGAGIADDDKTKVFEPLFTTKAKGIGLGLSLCKLSVDSHGGSIEVESEVGKGSTFTVSLPTTSTKKGAKILVVDDDEEIRDILTEALTRDRPYEIDVASNGTEALIKFGTQRPDLVILDLMMPEMDGLEVCRTIKQTPELSHMKVIIITGFPDHPMLEQVAKLGFTNIYTKPMKLELLLDGVDNALEQTLNMEV